VGDLADFCFIQSRPTFDERGKALSPTVARARFDAQVVIEVAQMNDDGLNARTASLPMLPLSIVYLLLPLWCAIFIR
jgi:hypothetical protein